MRPSRIIVSASVMFAASIRNLLYPMRLATARLPRGSWLRSACVPLLKAAAKRPALLRSLSEIRPLDRTDISFEPTDSWVMDDVYWFGVQGYEGVLTEIWARLCGGALSVLEIGGNVGLYTVIGAAATRGSYTVVEPVPHVAAILRANLRRNRLDRVRVIEGAAIPEREPQPVALNVSDEGREAPTGAHLVTGVEIARRLSKTEIRVEGFPILDLLAGCDLVKIDAEGIEHALLTAAMPHLIEHRPIVAVEVLPESEKLAAVIRRLGAAAGYSVNIVPAYGTDRVTTVAPEDFNASLPQRHHSKDVILATRAIAGR